MPTPRQLRLVIASLLCVALSLCAATWMFGRGGRGFFSPDSLEYRTQQVWRLPLTDAVLYRGTPTSHRPALADYLISQGLWSASGASEPVWLPTSEWRSGARDGESRFHREFIWRADEWKRWSERHADLAKVVWPTVLRALRRPGVTDTAEAGALLLAAQQARSPEEFEEMLSQ